MRLFERSRILSGNYVIKEDEPRNDSLLKWKNKYTIPGSINYDYHQETMNITKQPFESPVSRVSILSHLRKTNNKPVPVPTTCFEWDYENVESFKDKSSDLRWDPSSKMCHTATDIGNSLIMIGGMSKKCATVEVLEMTKDLQRIHQLPSDSIHGERPCCRWGHSASYIAPLHAIILIGGFDSTYNWNDIRLLFLSSNNDFGAWYKLKVYQEMDCKALHSSTVRYLKIIDKDKKLQRNLCEIYIFGGQFCNGGPYEYYNDVFKIQFYDELEPYALLQDNKTKTGVLANENENIYAKNKKAFFTTNMVETRSDSQTFPAPRSQHFAFIDHTNNRYWIYGGLDANTEFNDLWCLDLMSKEWKQIKYPINAYNILKAPGINVLRSHNFRLNLYADKFYYSPKQHKLVVIHCMDGSADTRSMYSILYRSDEVEKEEKDNAMEIYTGRRAAMLDKLAKLRENAYWIYTLDLKTKIWDILVDGEDGRPTTKITGSIVHRIGDRVWFIGGKDRINRLKYIFGFSIPTISISWTHERLIWIGNLKNDNNHKCFLKYLPKEIVCVILLFFKQNVW